MSDIFQRAMLEAYEEGVSQDPEQYFLSNLFREEVISPVDEIELDVVRGSRRIAADVTRGGGVGNTNYVNQYTNKSYKVPLYWEQTPITASMLNKRVPGMDAFRSPAMSEAAKIGYHVGHAQSEQVKKIKRAIELQAAQALQTGIVTLKNADNIDFHKDATLNNVPATKWDNSGTPIDDIEALAVEIFQKGKVKPNTAIFSQNAWVGFRKNASVQSFFDKRFIEPGLLRPEETVLGATLQGRISIGDFMLNLYTYNGFYENSSGVNTSYMNSETVIVMSSLAQLAKGYGATEVLVESREDYRNLGLPELPEFVAGAYVPFYYTMAPSTMYAGVQSAPIVIPKAIDTIGTITDCLT
jgi:hypothetical protein